MPGNDCTLTAYSMTHCTIIARHDFDPAMPANDSQMNQEFDQQHSVGYFTISFGFINRPHHLLACHSRIITKNNYHYVTQIDYYNSQLWDSAITVASGNVKPHMERFRILEIVQRNTFIWIHSTRLKKIFSTNQKARGATNHHEARRRLIRLIIHFEPIMYGVLLMLLILWSKFTLLGLNRINQVDQPP